MSEVSFHPEANPGRRVRLTRRGRLLTLLLLVGLLLLAFSVGRVSSQAAGPAAPPRTVVVQPGGTLWGIAPSTAPGADPRLVVDRISEANHLTGVTLRAGQRLVIPSS